MLSKTTYLNVVLVVILLLPNHSAILPMVEAVEPPPNTVTSYGLMGDYDSNAGILSPITGDQIVPNQSFRIGYRLPTRNIQDCEWIYISLRRNGLGGFTDSFGFKVDIAYFYNPGFDRSTSSFSPIRGQTIQNGTSSWFDYNLSQGPSPWNQPDGPVWITIAARYYDAYHGDYILMAANLVWVGVNDKPQSLADPAWNPVSGVVGIWPDLEWMSILVVCVAMYNGIGM
ncbi:hypothetical protein BC936DRAFT_147356 [Jimgerdemannia flammicorona]|uniref:DOMON domain-containing protein n=1 Tax=Jimgerdemannia flammicorona TaxID=994334 RepID=A0A433D5H6_9FUNG|nr:hypothetical protein BC936DRAFT_147356 [Jimgerdemannia flammicorona]